MPGSDGIQHKDGHVLEFDLVHFPDYSTLALAVQAQLRDAGIQVDLRMLDVAAGSDALPEVPNSPPLSIPVKLSRYAVQRW